MVNWEDKFVFRLIEDNIVMSPFPPSKHENYMHNFGKDNLENNMYSMISNNNKM